MSGRRADQPGWVVDALQIAAWDRANFDAMQRAGLHLVGWTCAVWEGYAATMDALADLHSWYRQLPETIVPVGTLDELVLARDAGRVGVFGVFQNTSPIDGRIDRLDLFHRLGVRMIQLTYNTQNLVGAGCYETHDSGLTRFGHEVVSRMNDLGIVIDLSHVGARTSKDALKASRSPVVYSHVCPAALKPHPRNKADVEMRHVADGGGIVGVTMFPPFLPSGNDSTVDEVVAVIEHVVDVCGEDHVGIGSDFIDGQSGPFLEWLNRDKGRGAFVSGPETIAGLTKIRMPAGLSGIPEFGNLRPAMTRRGWAETRIQKILGDNWVRVLGEIWRGERGGGNDRAAV